MDLELDSLGELAAAGDGEAFGAVVDRLSTPVFNLAYWGTGDRTEAEDLTQETFLRAFRALPRWANRSRENGFRGGESKTGSQTGNQTGHSGEHNGQGGSYRDSSRPPLRSWVLRIARNLVIDHLRSRSRKGVKVPWDGTCELPLANPGHAVRKAGGLIPLASAETDPILAVEKFERFSVLRDALDSLKPADRILVILFHLEGRSQAELSRILEIPVSTVKNRLYRARRTMAVRILERGLRKSP
ncbi:MAG: RNA polymerase sigma factor [Firmicutes bacterium]|nr:RNA polymerase sigma factor [Bacillota bacterium]